MRLISETIKKDGPNCDLNFIDVSGLDDLSGVFSYPNQIFNGNISQWDVSNVKNMSHMFTASHFNGDISAWNVSQVQDMSNLFEKTAFNGDTSQWDVSSVTDMSWMFWESQFNGDISQWNVSENTNMKLMFCRSPLELENRIPKWYAMCFPF